MIRPSNFKIHTAACLSSKIVDAIVDVIEPPKTSVSATAQVDPKDRKVQLFGGLQTNGRSIWNGGIQRGPNGTTYISKDDQ